MKAFATTVLIVVSLQCSYGQEPDFAWLEGTWKLKNKPSFEVWRLNPNGSFSGKAFRIQSGDTVVTEVITLKYFDGSFHYVPDVAGDQPPVNFRITRRDARSFVAENPQHDFPKIIRYTFSDAGGRPAIEASVEGNGKVIPYSFEKIK